MSRRIEVILGAKDQLSRTFATATGKVERFADQSKRAFNQLASFRNIAAIAGIGYIGKQFVDAAAKLEVFRNQLNIVTGSAGQAAQALEAIREFARKSPLETEDVVQSYVRMRSVGINPTIQQMETLGGVAVLMNRRMSEVLQAFISMEKEPLRNLGVEIDKTGSKAIITSGNIRREVKKDTESIREALLDVWGERFPNAIKTAANTTTAHIAVMKSEFFELAATVGQVFLPVVKKLAEAFGMIASSLRSGFTWQGKFATDWVDNAKETSGLLQAQARVRSRINDELQKEVQNQTELQRLYGNLARNQQRLNKLAEDKARMERIRQATGANPWGGGAVLPGTGELGGGTGGKGKGKGAKTAKGAEFFGFGERFEASMDAQQRMLELNEWMQRREIENEQELTRAKREELEKRQADLEIHLRQQEQLERMYSRARMDMARTVTHGLGNILIGYAEKAGQSQRQLAQTRKVIGLITATVDSFVAANSAMRDTPGPYPVKAAAYGLTLAKGFASVAMIAAQPLARGTGFFGGGMALVGEEGPELMRLPRGTQVYNTRQTRQSIGSVTFSPQVVVQGNASDATVTQIESSLQGLANQFENALRYGYIDPRRLGIATI